MKSLAPPDVSVAAPLAAINYATLLSTLGDKDRGTLERQVLAYETKLGAASAERWRCLVCVLMTLAPARAKLAGSNAMQFYIPDGKYRKQVFALQALANGDFAVYAPDVLQQAVQAGLLSGHAPAENGNMYHLAESHDTLAIDALNAKTPSPDAFYKDLTGWNRKAIRMTLPAQPSQVQVRATEQLCALAAAEWTIVPE